MIQLSQEEVNVLLAVLSPLFLAVGYFYRARRENRKDKKLALFLLMEIWHRMSIFYRTDFDDLFDTVFEKLKSEYKDISFSDIEMEACKNHFAPILEESAHQIAFSDIGNYEDRLANAVALLSSDDPIFAYKLNSSSKTKKFLSFIDSYMSKAFVPLESDGESGQAMSSFLKNKMAQHARMDCIKDLESDLIKLSSKISIYTLVKCYMAIRLRKHRLQNIGKDEVEGMVTQFLIPTMNEFNNSMQRSSLRAPAD